jgi:hypothetical protein
VTATGVCKKTAPRSPPTCGFHASCGTASGTPPDRAHPPRARLNTVHAVQRAVAQLGFCAAPALRTPRHTARATGGAEVWQLWAIRWHDSSTLTRRVRGGTFLEQCPHRMACARCDFYTPKYSCKAHLLEAKENLQKMRGDDPAHRGRAGRCRRRPSRPRPTPRIARRRPHSRGANTSLDRCSAHGDTASYRRRPTSQRRTFLMATRAPEPGNAHQPADRLVRPPTRTWPQYSEAQPDRHPRASTARLPARPGRGRKEATPWQATGSSWNST